MWVAAQSSNNVIEFRASDGTIVRSITVGTSPQGIAFDGANMWVTNSGSNSVMEIRVSDGTILGTYPVAGPEGPAFDGANMWIPSESTNTVSKF
jgi:DNA-binding beta-propeller fold protein YncE